LNIKTVKLVLADLPGVSHVNIVVLVTPAVYNFCVARGISKMSQKFGVAV